MGKAIGIPLCGLIVGLVLLSGWALYSPRLASQLPGAEESEAGYRGRSTSYWLGQLQSRNAAFRQQAIQALQQFGPKEEAVVRAIAVMLNDPNAAIRKGAAFALRKLGSDAKEAVPNLLLALEDEDRFVRINAACALYNIRPPEERVIAGVLPMLEDKSPMVRQTLLQFLQDAGPAAKIALPAVREALQDPEAEVCCKAAAALAAIEGFSQ